MKNEFGRTVVPIKALRPLLQAWVKKQDPHQMTNQFAGEAMNKGITHLAKDSGVSERRISGILNDTLNYENVSFDTADKLLCGMQMTAAWHCELAEFYTELEVAKYERGRVDGLRGVSPLLSETAA